MIKIALYLLIFIVLWTALGSRRLGWRTWWLINLLVGAGMALGVLT